MPMTLAFFQALRTVSHHWLTIPYLTPWLLTPEAVLCSFSMSYTLPTNVWDKPDQTSCLLPTLAVVSCGGADPGPHS